MRFRLMATYRGVPYEAGVGPSGADVVLFAACPPPEELGFEPATGHWRKRVIRAEVDALWESRPVGTFRNEPCIVLDDLGDRLHIAYLGEDATHAASAPAAAPPAPEPVPDGGGRAARRQRVQTRDIFCELADLAAIPRAAYALETETEGALCLMWGADGFEVFMAMDGARHEARSFPDEE